VLKLHGINTSHVSAAKLGQMAAVYKGRRYSLQAR